MLQQVRSQQMITRRRAGGLHRPAAPRPPHACARQSPLRLVAFATLLLFVAGCNPGAYPIDVFPELHYQPSYRRLEPDRLAPPDQAAPFRGQSQGPGSYAPGPAPADGTGQPAVFTPPVNWEQASRLQNPVPRNPDTLQRARQLYTVNCASCHGPGGRGDGPVAPYFSRVGFVAPVDFTSDRARGRDDGQLFWIVTNGLSNMPAFRTLLTDEERWLLVHFIREVQGQ